VSCPSHAQNLVSDYATNRELGKCETARDSGEGDEYDLTDDASASQ